MKAEKLSVKLLWLIIVRFKTYVANEVFKKTLAAKIMIFLKDPLKLMKKVNARSIYECIITIKVGFN